MLIKNTLFAIIIIALNSQITAKNYLYDSSGNYRLNDSTKSIKILPLGNSITVQSRGDASYRYFLWHLLKDSGYNVDFIGSDNGVGGYRSDTYDFDQDHEGHGGIEANQVNDKLDGWLQNYTPDIVLIHLGHNDLFHGQSVSSTVDDITNIINKLRADNPDVAILLAKIIPVDWVAPKWNELNTAYEKLAIEQNTAQSPVIIVDQFTNYIPKEDNKDDGVHPNIKGDEKMAKVWYNSLAKLLSGSVPACNPFPANDSIKISVTSGLSWDSDSGAISHNVYFGKDNPPDFVQSQTSINYNPGILNNSTTYYWRIDEVTATDTVRGYLWSFETIYEDLPPESAFNFLPIHEYTEAQLNAQLSWEPGYRTESNDIYFGIANPPVFKVNQRQTTYTPENLELNTIYYWRIDGNNEHGTTEGTILSFKTLESPILPDSWFSTDVGNVGLAGIGKENEGLFTVSGSGSDVTGTKDAFQYTYTNLSGDGEIKAKIVSQGNTDPMAQSGLMIREDMSAGSKFISVSITPGNGIVTQVRKKSDADSEKKIKDAVETPYWIKLMRMAEKYFIGQISEDGKSWKTVISQELTFTNQTKIGLYVASSNNDSLSTAVFDSVFVNNEPVSVKEKPRSKIIPKEFSIGNYPNPFNPSTKIHFSLPAHGEVSVVIYDMLGRKVKELLNENTIIGLHTLEWNATNSMNRKVSSGIYFYSVIFNNNIKTGKMLLLR